MTGEQSMARPARRHQYSMSSLRTAVATFAFFTMTTLNAPGVAAADLTIAEIERARMYGDDCFRTTITFSGEVIAGDLSKLSQLVEGAKAEAKEWKSLCFLNGGAPGLLMVMELDSQGGSYTEAWEIAKFLHYHGISTLVRDGKNCLSACALIFLGGSGEGADGATLASRALMPKAQLGFQAPYPKLESRQHDATEVSAALRTAFTVSAEFIKHSSELDVPRGMLSDLLHPSPDNLFLVNTAKKLTLLNISLNTSGVFDFHVDKNPPMQSLSFAQMHNWCKNSYEPDVRQNPNFPPLVPAGKTPYVVARTVDNYFGLPARALEIFGIPIDHVGEGSVQYCIIAAVSRKEPSDPSKGLGVDCIGYVSFYTDNEFKAALKKKGFDGFREAAGDRRCNTDPHASVPPDTALPDIPALIESVKRERPIFSSK